MASEMQALETPEHDALSQVYDDEEEEKGIPAYGFNKVDTLYEQNEPDWIERQHPQVRYLLEKPSRCGTLGELKKLGEECYNAEDAQGKTERQRFFLTLTDAQKSVFWSNYRIRKVELLKKMAVGPAARALLTKIKDAKSLARCKIRFKSRFIRTLCENSSLTT